MSHHKTEDIDEDELPPQRQGTGTPPAAATKASTTLPPAKPAAEPNKGEPDHEEDNAETAVAETHEDPNGDGTLFGLFSTRRPKNLIAGTSSGLKNIARGVATGTIAFVSLPVMGAKTEGIKGAAKGVAAGSLAFVTLTCAGAVSGAVQIARGACNTPEAIVQGITNETVWDEHKREWIRCNLHTITVPATDDDILAHARVRRMDHKKRDEREKKANAKFTEGDDDAQPSGEPIDGTTGPSTSRKPTQDYYETLGLTKGASPSEIKKAYAKKALQHHPDKNPDDVGATERFKAVNKAYRVLSDATLRAEYDQNGTLDDDMENHQQGGLPPLEHLIGGEPFLEVYGGLRLARIHMNDLCEFTPEEEHILNERRIFRCACKLAEVLDSIIHLEATGVTSCPNLPPASSRDSAPDPGKSMAARAAMAARIDTLMNAPMGRDLLHVVAPRYKMAADKYLGAVNYNPLKTAKVAIQDVAYGVSSAKNVVSNVWTVARAATQQKQVTQDDALPLLLSIASRDVSDTIEAIGKLVLHDHAVNSEQRVLRALLLDQYATAMMERCATGATPIATAPVTPRAVPPE